jgi:uncharacterized protein DUF5681
MARWTKGQSGNPRGRPRRGSTFSEALRAKGTPEELAELAWKAARNGEPWAIQTLFNRLEPQPTQVWLTHEVDHGPQLDYRKLTDDEIRQLESLLERATTPVAEIKDGEGPAPSG